MDSWSHASEGKGILFPEEMESPVDALVRSRKELLGWDCNSPYNLENNGLISHGEAVESMEFMELGFHDMMKKHFSSDLGAGTAYGDSVTDFSKNVSSPTRMVSSNSSFGEEESRTKFSTPLLEASSQESSLIDLKLGRLADSKESLNTKFYKERSAVSSGGSSSMVKKTRGTGSYSQSPFCQVLGCNKDLSSSKEYHKRHRVCDVHSKTPRVIVNGVEQRFCQQCSRFHLLAEFDDVKRSCRRRLAGHNERRRKPQVDALSGRPHKFFQSCPGTRFSGTSLPNGAPFVFSNIIPGSVLFPGRNEQTSHCGNGRVVEQSFCSSQFTAAHSNVQLVSESPYLHHSGKQFGSKEFPPETENKAVLIPPLSLQVSNSSCALSLLSAHPGDSLCQSTRVAPSSPLIIDGSQDEHRVNQTIGVVSSLQGHTTDGLYSCGTSTMEVDRIGSVNFSDSNHPVNFKVQRNGTLQGSDLLSAKYRLSPERGSTVDLLQLSSHLQRVEQQRNSVYVKPENEESSCFLGT